MKIILEIWDDNISARLISELIKEMLPIENKTAILRRNSLVIQKTTLKSGTMKFCIYRS
jgi:hypothetical protein